MIRIIVSVEIYSNNREKSMSICEHCKHYKTKTLNGVIVSEYCKKGSGNIHWVLKCPYWSRSLKSRLGLVTEKENL